MEDLSRFGAIFIAFCVVFGLFGNFQIILMFIKNQEMRNKSNFLLLVHAVVCLTILITRPLNLLAGNTTYELSYIFCVPFGRLYYIQITLQIWTSMLFAIDLLLNLVSPIWYPFVSLKKFAVVILGVLSTLVAVVVLILYEGRIEDAVVNPDCFHPVTRNMNIASLFLIGFAVTSTLYIYGAAIAYLRMRVNIETLSNRKCLKSIVVIVANFLVWCGIGAIGTFILTFIEISPEVRYQLSHYNEIHMFSCFTVNFYICLWRSSVYRAAFKSNMRFLLCLRSRAGSGKISVISVSNSSGKSGSYFTSPARRLTLGQSTTMTKH